MDEPVPVQPSPFADRGLIGTFPPPYQSQAPSTSIIQNQPQPSKSPQFWDSGIMVVFSAVQANSLRCRFKVLDDIFGIPLSTQSQNQGTEVNPIALPASITTEKFESFLMYLNCRGWNEFDDKVAANILNLLDISALLEADGALSYAMSKVVGLNLPAPQLLGLAWRHGAHLQNITVELIHPMKPPLSYSGLVQLVEKTKFENLQDGCKSRTIEHMKSYQDYPTVPDVFHAAVSEVVQLFNIPHDKRVRQANLEHLDKVMLTWTRGGGRDTGKVGGIDVEVEVEVLRWRRRRRHGRGNVEAEMEVEEDVKDLLHEDASDVLVTTILAKG
ncbi:hypothetical protein EV368DRAFT_67845 [Lentinula lateritia]|nr:hypothetical protein EV368DRAFT_67845 [Lentinula lateritia]